MSDIGRLDVAHSLRQFAEISGEYAPELGEGIVPTVQLANIDDSPFSVAEPWAFHAEVTAVAAQYSYVAVYGTTLPGKSWISVEQVIIGFLAANTRVLIRAYSLSDLPALGTTFAVASTRQAEGPLLRTIGEIVGASGASATAPVSRGLLVRGTSGESVIVPCRMACNNYGAIVAVSSAVNESIEIAFAGRLHITSSQ